MVSTLIRSKLQRTRKLARELGEDYYYSGVECVNGHLAERRVSDGRCMECARKLPTNEEWKNDEGIPITRAAAKMRGSKYYVGQPCAYGHVSYRYTATTKCVECQNERMRKYREQQRNNVKEAEDDGL